MSGYGLPPDGLRRGDETRFQFSELIDTCKGNWLPAAALKSAHHKSRESTVRKPCSEVFHVLPMFLQVSSSFFFGFKPLPLAWSPRPAVTGPAILESTCERRRLRNFRCGIIWLRGI